MVGTKIARPRDGRHKNNSPKGWMGGEFYGRHENNSPKTGELNGRHENDLPKEWMAQKKTCQRDGWMESYMVDIKIARQRMEN